MCKPQAYIDYVSTLPCKWRGDTRVILWTIESFAKAVPLRYPGYSLKPGQTWRGVMAKYIFICPHHGEFKAITANFLKDSACHQGAGCKRCMIEAKRNISRALVGTTNSDGVMALEIDFRWRTDSHRKAGGYESAVLRCRCPHCGNEEWWVQAGHFQQPGHSTHCGCQGKRETIGTHLRNKKKAESLAMLYISPVWYDLFTKIGITNDFTRRSTQHEVVYEGAYFVSHLMPRAWVFVAEQILLRETLQWQPEGPFPKEMIETYWPGSSELRDWHMDPEDVVARFHEIINDIKSDGDWYRVYKECFQAKPASQQQQQPHTPLNNES